MIYLPLARQPLGLPFEVNRASPQARGLVGWWPFVARAPHPRGAVVPMTMVAGVDIGPSAHGLGLRSIASTQGLTATASAPYTINPPVTVAVTGMFVGTPSASVALAGVLNNSAVSSPFVSYVICIAASTSIVRLAWNNAGAFVGGTSTAARPADYTLFSLVGVFADGRQELYVNGVSQVLQTTAFTTIAYGATAQVVVGNDWASVGRTANCHIYDARIYNRALSAAEVWALYAPQTRWELYGVPVAMPYYIAPEAPSIPCPIPIIGGGAMLTASPLAPAGGASAMTAAQLAAMGGASLLTALPLAIVGGASAVTALPLTIVGGASEKGCD